MEPPWVLICTTHTTNQLSLCWVTSPSLWAVCAIKQQKWPCSFQLWPWTFWPTKHKTGYTSGCSQCIAVNPILLLWKKRPLKQRATQLRWRRSDSALMCGIYERHWCECKTLTAAYSLSQISAALICSALKPGCRLCPSLLTLLSR